MRKNLSAIAVLLVLLLVTILVTSCITPPSHPVPTPTLSPSPTTLKPPATATPPPTINSILITYGGVQRHLVLSSFVRSANPTRFGWDVIEGTLQMYMIDPTGEAGHASPVDNFFEDGKLRLEPAFGSYQWCSTIEEPWGKWGTTSVYPWLSFRVSWEGATPAVLQLQKPSQSEAPYGYVSIAFRGEVPTVAQKLYFVVNVLTGTNWGYVSEGPFEVEEDLQKWQGGGTRQRSFDARKVVTVKNQLLLDGSSIPTKESLGEWFGSDIASRLLKDSLTRNMPANVKLLKFEQTAAGLTLDLQFTNPSREKDLEIRGDQNLYRVRHYLDTEGKLLGVSQKQFPFWFERSIIPPGFTINGSLAVPFEDVPNGTRYIVGSLCLLESEAIYIIDLG